MADEHENSESDSERERREWLENRAETFEVWVSEEPREISREQFEVMTVSSFAEYFRHPGYLSQLVDFGRMREFVIERIAELKAIRDLCVSLIEDDDLVVREAAIELLSIFRLDVEPSFLFAAEQAETVDFIEGSPEEAVQPLEQFQERFNRIWADRVTVLATKIFSKHVRSPEEAHGPSEDPEIYLSRTQLHGQAPTMERNADNGGLTVTQAAEYLVKALGDTGHNALSNAKAAISKACNNGVILCTGEGNNRRVDALSLLKYTDARTKRQAVESDDGDPFQID